MTATITATLPSHSAGSVEEEAPTQGRTRSLVWGALLASLLPIGIEVGLPFQLSPADVLMPLLVPFALRGLRAPITKFLVGVVAWSVIVVLLWSLYDSSPAVPPLQTLVFFWKPWVALLVAYRLVREAPDLHRSAHRVLTLLAWAQVGLIGLITAGFLVTGDVTREGLTDSGLGVTGYTAGIWELPIGLYGFGQVNVTACLLAVGVPIIVAHAMARTGIFRRVFWLSFIPVSWWFVITSGSRTSFITSLIFVVLLFLNRRSAAKELSIGKVVLSIALITVAMTQADRLLEASPKYRETITSVTQGDSSSVASGRDELGELVIADVRRSPLFGSGYGDFHRFHSDDGSPWVDSSPHNTYLAPFLKGGIPVGIAYLVLLLRSLPFNRLSLVRGTEWLSLPYTLALTVGLFPFIDALTTPVLAGTILTTCGMLMACQQAARQSGDEGDVVID